MRCRHRGVAKILSKSARGTKIFRKYFDGATRSAKNTKNVLRQFRSLIRVLVHLADTLKIRSNGGERERERGKESISERRGKIWERDSENEISRDSVLKKGGRERETTPLGRSTRQGERDF